MLGGQRVGGAPVPFGPNEQAVCQAALEDLISQVKNLDMEEVRKAYAEAHAKDVALHVAAERPQYLTRDEVEAGDIEKEREILTNKALAEGKPQQIVEKIVEGQIGKFYQERVLPEQTFVKDNSLTVSKYLGDAKVKKFVRFEVGA